MPETELDELQELADLVNSSQQGSDEECEKAAHCEPPLECTEDDGDERPLVNPKMWAVYADSYTPCEAAIPQLDPGQYTIRHSHQRGIYFEKHSIHLDELFLLPDSASEEVVDGIEQFWTKEEHFRKFGFLWKRGVLLWGPPGSGKCLQKSTPIIMYDGSIKKVEDIQVGDLLMGDDSTPRMVLSLARGREQMYKVHQQNGDNYNVNESHILSLERTTWKKGRHNPHKRTTEKVDISVKEYIQSSNNFKKEYFGYKVAVDFPQREVPVDPYFLGLWLGDGTSAKVEITTMDEEVKLFLESYADKCKLRFVTGKGTTSGKAISYSLSGESFKTGSNSILTALKELNLINNKHIPEHYKINDKHTRLKLLAGLLDSDGYLGTNCFEFSNTNKQLIQDVVFLARSLGFKVSISDKTSYNKKTEFVGESQSVHISGHTDQIPTIIQRKQATPRQQIKDPLHTSIELEQLEVDDYYGFELDGNKRFLLGDFTVTHNTTTLQMISANIINKGGLSLYLDNPGLGAQGLELLRRIEPTRPIIVMLEDIDAIIQSYGESELLSLLDGELQIDNVVFIATTNYPELLDKRLINRPSRFDVVKKIGMPSKQARHEYITKKNPKLSQGELDMWVSATEHFSVAHLKELIVSVECFGVEFDSAVTRLKTMINSNISSDEYQSDSSGGCGFIKN